MKNIRLNHRFAKVFITGTILIYSVALSIFLWHNLGLTRYVVLESKKVGGIVHIVDTNNKTVYLLGKEKVKVITDNPLSFLFLRGNNFLQDSFLGAVLKLLIAVFTCIFLWKLDFYEPFEIPHFKRLILIFRLFIVLVLSEWMKDIYSSNWVNNHLGKEEYQYNSDMSSYSYWFLITVVTVIVYIYGQAVKNKEEQSLIV